MILVAGATGMVGREVCRRLEARGESVVALVRSTAEPSSVQALQEVGARTVVGDLRDPGSLAAACAGASAVISTVSSMPFAFVAGENDIETTDRRGQMALIDAARAAGVQHFVYLSFSGQIDLEFPLRDAKRDVEAHLRASGMTYTILRPSFFMEVWLSPAVGFDAAHAKAVIYGAGTNPISWIAFGDVAEFAVRSLALPSAHDATIELGGPEAITPLAVVHHFETTVGRPFDVQHVPAEVLERQQAGATDDMARSFSGLMRCYAAGDAIPMRDTIAQFGFEPTTVGSFAAASLATIPVGIG